MRIKNMNCFSTPTQILPKMVIMKNYKLVSSRLCYHFVCVPSYINMEVQSMKSEKGKNLLIVEGAKFHQGRTLRSGQIHWRCINKACKAKLYTVGENQVIKSDLTHNHEVNVCILARQILGNGLKRKAKEDISLRPSKLIHLKIKEKPALLEDLSLKDLENIKRNIYNARRSELPPLPKCIAETHEAVAAIKVNTVKNDNFLLVNDRENNIIIFSCFTNLNFLCTVNTLYMDGTFQYCAKYFYQLFTVHGFKNNQYIPLVFALLPNKQKSTYVKLFIHIQRECSKLDLNLQPKEIIVDFEVAIHQALRTVFVKTDVSGCLFHLKQAWYRKILEFGLSSEYKDPTSHTGKWLKHVFGLPFLPPEEVSDVFCFDLISDKPENDRVTLFCDYLVETYIAEDSKFPPHMWAEMSADTTRTTNACESFHAHFNNSFNSPHPNIFKFVDELLVFQTYIYTKIVSANKTCKKMRNVVQKKQFFLQQCIDMHKDDWTPINRKCFLTAMCYHNLPVNE